VVQQDAADQHDLKAVYGPRDADSVPIHCAMVRPLSQIMRAFCLDGWNTFVVSSNRENLIQLYIPDWDTNHDLMEPTNATEVLCTVNQMASGKASGPDGLPSELFKAGGPEIINKLVTLYGNIWSKQSVPQDFKDALIVHIFKRKGDWSVCDDHHRILLLSVPGKILALVISVSSPSMLAPTTSCLKVNVASGLVAVSWTHYCLFTACQHQEKCREQTVRVICHLCRPNKGV